MKKSVRLLKEMEKVVYDKEFARKNPDLELYRVQRGVKRKGELRYDITFLPPEMLGEEYARTKGNHNSDNFPELYTLLEGEALVLLQKARGERIEEIYALKMKAGDWINIKPEESIILINPTKKTVKTANWVSERNENIYQDLEKMGGMGYYYTKSGWIKNENYSFVPELEFKRPLEKKPENLDYLKG